MKIGCPFDKAELAVGSIKADLDAFKGLKNPFKIKNNEQHCENGEAILKK
jgi:hypothetical protein